MTSGLENLLRGSSKNEEKTRTEPKNISEAIKDVTKYIESQLPKVIDVDFTPLCFDITDDENKILMGGFHGNIAIFYLTAPEPKIIKDIELCSCPISTVVLTLKDSIALVVNEMKVLYILNFPSFNLVQNFVLNSEKITICPGFGKEFVMISTYTNTVLVYDLKQLEDPENKSEFEKREIITDEIVSCLDICDDGSLIAFGFSEGFIRLYHGETESVLQQTEKFSSSIELIIFAQYRKLIAAGLSDARVIVWNIDSGLTVRSVIECHNLSIKGLAFVKDNRYLITGGEDTKIIVHDLKVDRSPYQLELFDYKVLCFKTSASHTKLYYTQNMNKLMV